MALVDERGRLFGRINLLDVAVALAGFFLFFFFFYSYRLIGHRALAVYRVTPSRVTTGIDRVITVYGTGFDFSSVVYLGNLPLDTRFLNEARLEAVLPLEISEAKQEMYVRNGRGRLIEKADAFETIWKPEILSVEPKRLVAGEESRLVILGRHFEPDCTVTLGKIRLKKVARLTSGRLEATIVPRGMLPGWVDLSVRNGKDRLTTRAKAVQILRRRPHVEPVIIPRVEPGVIPHEPVVIPSGPSPAVTLFSFPELDAKSIRMFQAGALDLGRGDKPRGKVLDIQQISKVALKTHPTRHTRIQRTTQTQVVVASVLLLGDLQTSPGRSTFSFKGTELHAGSRVLFRFRHPLRPADTLNATGVALTEPVPQPDRTRELVESH